MSYIFQYIKQLKLENIS